MTGLDQILEYPPKSSQILEYPPKSRRGGTACDA
jgi:hypothetical protein